MQEGFYVSWETVLFLILLGFLLLAAFLVFHAVQALRVLRQTLTQVRDFLNHTEEIVRNLKGITYKLDRQLDDTGVVARRVRESVEEVSTVLSVLGRLTGRPTMALLSILGPILWWRRRRRR